jgi:hypothetical protein
MMEARGPGVLDRPIESGDDSFLRSDAVCNISAVVPASVPGPHSYRR